MLKTVSLLYLRGPQGDVPVAMWRPASVSRVGTWFLHCPAFAEEMNKARHIVARQARSFAAQGYTVLVPDLAGTGDSTLGFEAARWDLWCAEITAVAEAAYANGARRLVLWGLRSGCLLAVTVASRLKRAPAALFLWQPVFSGKQQLGQFLRLKSAARMLGEGSQVSTSASKEMLREGQPVEVAGYHLTPLLYTHLDQIRLDAPVPQSTSIALIEVSSRGGNLSTVAQKQLSEWEARGHLVYAKAVNGEPFWATQELGDAVDLLALSTEALATLGINAEAGDRLPRHGVAHETAGSEGVPWSTVSSDERMRTLAWQCQGSELVGVLHEPEDQVRASGTGELGVLIVVGGPQYRVGSHRQFVHLAQALAAEGFSVLRFDYRGMGDSAGELLGFLSVAQDIRSAVDALQMARPSVQRVLLWGLCDAATAAMNYAHEDRRVVGLVLANPWVHSPEGAARVQLTQYYRDRLLSRQFWGKVLGRGMEWRRVWADFSVALKRVLAPNPESEQAPGATATSEAGSEGCAKEHAEGGAGVDLVAYFREAARAYQGDMLLVTSGRDYTAAEFENAVRGDRPLRRALRRNGVHRARLEDADHTFSTAVWRKRVESLSARFARDVCKKCDSD